MFGLAVLITVLLILFVSFFVGFFVGILSLEYWYAEGKNKHIITLFVLFCIITTVYIRGN